MDSIFFAIQAMTKWSVWDSNRSKTDQSKQILVDMHKNCYECEYYCPRCEGTWMKTSRQRGQYSICPKCGYVRHPYRMTVWILLQFSFHSKIKFNHSNILLVICICILFSSYSDVFLFVTAIESSNHLDI